MVPIAKPPVVVYGLTPLALLNETVPPPSIDPDALGADYAWPGNVRELEQCVRKILIRGFYRPQGAGRDVAGGLADSMRDGQLTAELLVQRYCALVYAQTRSYQETARRLGLDRRTVKARIDDLAGPRGNGGGGNGGES